MQEASDALSKTADNDTVSTCQVSAVQLMTDKKHNNHFDALTTLNLCGHASGEMNV